MSDFQELVAKRKTESDARLAEMKRVAQQKLYDAMDAKQRAVSILQDRLIPILNDAQASLTAAGVPSYIHKSWESDHDPESPYVTFGCGNRDSKNPLEAFIGSVAKFTTRANLLVVNSDVGREISITDDMNERGCIVHAVDKCLTSFLQWQEKVKMKSV